MLTWTGTLPLVGLIVNPQGATCADTQTEVKDRRKRQQMTAIRTTLRTELIAHPDKRDISPTRGKAFLWNELNRSRGFGGMGPAAQFRNSAVHSTTNQPRTGY